MNQPANLSSSSSPLRYQVLGVGQTLAVLDCGTQDCLTIWKGVTPGLKSHITLLLVDRSGYLPEVILDPKSEAELVRALIDTVVVQFTYVDRLILVGVEQGSRVLCTLANHLGGQLKHSGTVLIDPDPTVITTCPNSALETIPITVILPGTQPDGHDQAARNRRIQQESMISASANCREIIAGRSRTCIPLERPDVVVEAILRYLDTDA